MTKTTVASTALGMYESGFVRKSSTTSTTTAVVSCDIWLRPPASSTISVLVGEPFTGNVAERPAATLASDRPTRSVFSLNGSS